MLDAVAERAPDGFDAIDEVMPEAERRVFSDRYKEATGLAVEEINAQPSIIGAADPGLFTGKIGD